VSAASCGPAATPLLLTLLLAACSGLTMPGVSGGAEYRAPAEYVTWAEELMLCVGGQPGQPA
jgi:hypothetical protein